MWFIDDMTNASQYKKDDTLKSDASSFVKPMVLKQAMQFAEFFDGVDG